MPPTEQKVRFGSLSPWAALVILVTGFTVAFWDVLVIVDTAWRKGPIMDHGYVVLIISGWLLCRSQRDTRVSELRPDLLFLIPLAAISLLYLSGVSNLSQIILPTLLILSAGAIFGRKVAARALIPILFLHFALPGWGLIQPILQNMTIWSVTIALRTIEIPVFIEGIYVTLPAGKFAIEEGCSGLKYFIVGCTIAALVGYLYSTSWRRRILILLLGGSFAIVGNWVRVFSVIVAGHVTEMQHPWVHDHLRLGWYIFAVLLVPFFIIARKLEDEPGAIATQQDALGVKSESYEYPGQLTSLRNSVFIGVSLVTTAFLAIGPIAFAFSSTECDGCKMQLRMPSGANGWSVEPAETVAWQPIMAGAAQFASQRYVRNGYEVSLYLAVYGSGKLDGEMVNSENIFESREMWQFLQHETSKIELDGVTIRFNDLMLSRAGRSRFIGGYWYEVDGRPYANRNMARIARILGPFSERRYQGLIAFSIPCADSCATAAKAGTQFIKDNYPDIRDALEAAISIDE